MLFSFCILYIKNIKKISICMAYIPSQKLSQYIYMKFVTNTCLYFIVFPASSTQTEITKCAPHMQAS